MGLAFGCAGRRPVPVADHVVIVRDTTLSGPGLSPAVVTITSGQTVEWVNRTGSTLRMVFDKASPRLPRFLRPLAPVRAAFPTAGTYAYKVHLATDRQLETFAGRIVVLPEGTVLASMASGGPAPTGSGTAASSSPDHLALSLGLSLQDLTPALAEAFGIKEEKKGALVTKVLPGSQAEREGLREGDVVTAVNKAPVTGAEAFRRLVGEAVAGEKLLLRVVREDRVFFVVLIR